MRTYHFDEQSMWEDFTWTYRLKDISAWNTTVDQIYMAMNPDGASWDDYGLRSRSNVLEYSTPYLVADSDDGTDRITLSGAGYFTILIPATTLVHMGPGGVNIGIQYRKKDIGTRTTIANGRLALIDTGGA